MRESWNPKDISGTWYPEYREKVVNCSACPARKECTLPVPGEGNIDADLVFVGRNPGRTEDLTGRPFVGNAGQVFEQMLMEYEVERPDVFVTNLYLCHTKGNRLPSLQEVKACVPFLRRSLSEIKPKVVVTFGACTNWYINQIQHVSSHSGQVFRHKMGFHVVPSIHPAAVCHNRAQFFQLKKTMNVVMRVLAW